MLNLKTTGGYPCRIPFAVQHNPLYVGLAITSERPDPTPNIRIAVQLTNAQAEDLGNHLLNWAAFNRGNLSLAAANKPIRNPDDQPFT